MARFASFAALSLFLATAAVADPPAPPAANPGEIVVTGHGADRDTRDRQAVGRIARPVSAGGFEGRYGRWDVPICVVVAGLPSAHDQLIADRIGQIADSLRITVQGPGCHPNIYIVVTPEPDIFIRKARLTSGSLLSNIALSQVEDMVHSHAAVRWAGMADQVGRMGDVGQHYSALAQGGHGVEMKTLGSLIKAPVKTGLVRMVVIVDAKQLTGLKYSTLSGYLAMVSLAQLRPDADAPMVNTVLSTFRDRSAAPDDMTDFDHAYLTGLYAMQPDNSGAAQKQQIVGRINRDLDRTTAR